MRGTWRSSRQRDSQCKTDSDDDCTIILAKRTGRKDRVANVKLTRIRQQFNREHLDNVDAALDQELQSLQSQVRRGDRIAIAAGSRGIANIASIVRTTVEFVRAAGAEPFVVPAMGSHGGATDAGQAEMLASFGITEQNVGAPVQSSVEVVELPQGDSPVRLFMDRLAHESDGVILINRIKPHTDYHGRYGSGLVKMAVIGLGKHAQALEIHRFGLRGLLELMPAAAARLFDTGKILGGVAIVENAYHQTKTVRVLRADQIMAEEPKLLAEANANMPKLPVDQLDILFIDWIGKDISGVGIDTNIIGRIGMHGVAESAGPDIKAIVVCDVTPGSHGNALGIGLAEVITKRLFDAIDFDAMYKNAYTSAFLGRANVPVVAKDDADALRYALRACGAIEPGSERIARIKNTLDLDELYVSDAVLKDLAKSDGIDRVSQPIDMLDDSGNLTEF